MSECEKKAEATGIEAQVCADIARRQLVGLAKYGVTVQDNPLAQREWLQHAYEECLDQAVYLKRFLVGMEAGKPCRPWVGKLRHSRDLCDDWGFIRDKANKLIITVPVTASPDEWIEHRRNNTDPTQPVVDYLLAVLNAGAVTRGASAPTSPAKEQP